MLKPKYLERLPEAMIELYSQAEQDILADMARRISTYDYWIPAADWQYRKLIEMGNFHSYVMRALSARTGKSREELERLMDEAGAKSIEFDTAIYKNHGLSPPPLAESQALRAVLATGLRKTNGLFENLTATTANTASRQFEQALDLAWMQITSGAFDANAAIRQTVKGLARQGVGAVTYPSGHTDTIEVAVRRAVVTGVNQCALRLQETLADEMGCDLVETTAHYGARPSHAEWQGRIFSRSGKSRKYPDFTSSTGYGSGDGLGGWNCRHSFAPYFEGSPRAYTQEDLDKMEEKTISYNGQMLTEYDATQQQRYIERQIRRWKRENVGMAAAGLDTTESAAKIKQWQDTQNDFLRQTRLKRQYDREQVASYGRSQASKASHDAKVWKLMQEDAIIKANSGLPKKIMIPDVILQNTVDLEAIHMNGVVPKGVTLTNVYAMAGPGTCNQIKDWKRLYNQYGGDPSKWSKMSGTIETDNYRYVIHWYERDNIQIESKLKGARKL